MKQGPSKNSYEPKTEPKAHAVNVAGASQLGQKVGYARAVEPLYTGRGYESPAPKGVTIHHSGSQGRHK